MGQSLVDRLAAAEADADDADGAIGEVWDALVDLDEKTKKADLLDAVEACIEIISEYDPEQFVIEEESDDDDAEEAAA